MSTPGPSLDGPKVLFLDLDGTVRHGKDELGHFVNRVEDVVIFPEVHDRVRAWRQHGGVIIGVTNQAGVALGYMDEQTHRSICAETQARAKLDYVLSCTHHPHVGCWCRKPMAGLIWQGVGWVNQRHLTLPDRSQCLMVGDRPEDAGAAAAAGVQFLDASLWRAGAWTHGDGE